MKKKKNQQILPVKLSVLKTKEIQPCLPFQILTQQLYTTQQNYTSYFSVPIYKFPKPYTSKDVLLSVSL